MTLDYRGNLAWDGLRWGWRFDDAPIGLSRELRVVIRRHRLARRLTRNTLPGCREPIMVMRQKES